MNNDSNSTTQGLVHVAASLDRIEERIASLAQRVEQHLTHRRKTPTKRVREAHILAIGAMGGACPFCDDPLFDADGRFLGVVHHVDRASDASIDATMPTCAPCNLRFNSQPAPRAVVDAYHLRRARHDGPLMKLMRRGMSHSGAAFTITREKR